MTDPTTDDLLAQADAWDGDWPGQLITDLAAEVRALRATVDQPNPEFAEALEDAGLLQDEYPDQMAERSCTCTPDAVCGAHRMLARYNQLFEAFRQSNREKREAKRALRTASGDRYNTALAIIRRMRDGWTYDSTDPEEGTWYRGVSLDSYEHDQEDAMSDAERAVLADADRTEDDQP